MSNPVQEAKDAFIEQLFRERRLDRKQRWAAWLLRFGMLVFAFFAFTTIWYGTTGTAVKIAHKLQTLSMYASYVDDSILHAEKRVRASILIIPIRGVISGHPLNEAGSANLLTTLLMGGASNIVLDVRRALENASNRADLAEVVFFIDSPGGAITPSDEIYAMIKEWKKRHPTIRVSAYLYGVAASGGYYVAMAADTVVTNPTTMVGSIGVIMQTLDVSELAKRFGIKMKTIKSGEMKDIGNVFREMTEDEKKLLQGLIQQMHARFVDVIIAGRPRLTRADVERIADGRVFSADDALSFGLVDSMTTNFDAFIRERSKKIMKERGANELFVFLPSFIPGM